MILNIEKIMQQFLLGIIFSSIYQINDKKIFISVFFLLDLLRVLVEFVAICYNVNVIIFSMGRIACRNATFRSNLR